MVNECFADKKWFYGVCTSAAANPKFQSDPNPKARISNIGSNPNLKVKIRKKKSNLYGCNQNYVLKHQNSYISYEKK